MTETNRDRGTGGEVDVVEKLDCPNCGKALELLPSGFPLFDVQCTGCVFRAQIKTNRCRPKIQVYGAGHQVLSHFQRTGQLIPPLIVSFSWSAGRRRLQEMWFYPFLTNDNIKKRTRGVKGSRPGYKEFNYVGLLDEHTPRVLLYKSPDR